MNFFYRKPANPVLSKGGASRPPGGWPRLSKGEASLSPRVGGSPPAVVTTQEAPVAKEAAAAEAAVPKAAAAKATVTPAAVTAESASAPSGSNAGTTGAVRAEFCKAGAGRRRGGGVGRRRAAEQHGSGHCGGANGASSRAADRSH